MLLLAPTRLRSLTSCVASLLSIFALSTVGCDGEDEPIEASEPRVFDDDFADGQTDGWLVHNGHLANAYVSSNGFVLEPNAWTLWYYGSQAVQYYQLVTGGFALTADVSITSRDGSPIQPSWRLGGLQLRDPGRTQVDAYHGAFGMLASNYSSTAVFESKNTNDSVSTFTFRSNPSGAGQIRLCRSGSTVRTMFRSSPADAWTLADERERTDLPATLAAGPMAFNNNGQANTRVTFANLWWAPLASIGECESVEQTPPCVRQFDGTGDISALDDEFDHPGTLACWRFLSDSENRPAPWTRLDVDTSTPGHLVLAPTAGGWFNDYTGPLLYKEVSGDFMFEISVSANSVTNPSASPTMPFNSAGMMVRDPASRPGAQNHVLWNVGSQFAAQANTEGKDTRASISRFLLTPGVTRGRLRMCRIGSTFYLARRLANEAAFTIVHTYVRPDLPATVQAGMMSSAWNGHGGYPSLELAPDVVGTWDYVRFRSITDLAQCTAD